MVAELRVKVLENNEWGLAACQPRGQVCVIPVRGALLGPLPVQGGSVGAGSPVLRQTSGGTARVTGLLPKLNLPQSHAPEEARIGAMELSLTRSSAPLGPSPLRRGLAPTRGCRGAVLSERINTHIRNRAESLSSHGRGAADKWPLPETQSRTRVSPKCLECLERPLSGSL